MDDTLLRKIKPCAIDKPFIFVSYSAKDKEIVYKDVYELQIRGWNIWLDERNLDKTKESWKQDALDAITLATCFMGMFYVSKNSLSSENCYDEIKRTESKEAMARHFMAPVRFLAIEVKEIDNIEKYAQTVIRQLTYSNLSLEEKNRRTEVVTYFVHGPFKGNNEKVRIKPIDTYPSEEDYYNAMVEQFTKAGLRPTEANYFPRVKLYREACTEMSSAKTDSDYRSASKKFNDFIGKFSIEEQQGTAGNGFFFEELRDAKQREKLCLDKAEIARKNAIYDGAVSLIKQKTVEGYSSAKENLRQIPGWKDADEKIIECQKGMDTIHEQDYNLASGMLLLAKTQEDYKKIADAFVRLNDYKDAKAMAASCKKKEEELRRQSNYERSQAQQKVKESQIASRKYVEAIGKLTDARTYEEYRSLAKTFESLDENKDAPSLATYCKTMADEAKKHQQANRWRMIVEVILAVALCLVWFGIGWHVNTLEQKKGRESLLKYVLKSVDIGDTIFFGRYEQDNDANNGKESIEWVVLDKEEDGTLLLLSKHPLDAKPYNNEYAEVTWESCDLREWLNNGNKEDSFYDLAFDEVEKGMVVETELKNSDNPNYGTEGGNDTMDKVFLLSVEEAARYFSSDEARQCKPTDYAILRNVYVNENTGACRWWLRSPGRYGNHAALVSSDGSVNALGVYVFNDDVGVRPACRVNPES